MDTRLEQLNAQGFDQSYRVGRDAAGRFSKAIRVKCSQCDALCINGVPCHETGCPHATRECRECGEPTVNRGGYCDDCRHELIGMTDRE